MECIFFAIASHSVGFVAGKTQDVANVFDTHCMGRRKQFRVMQFITVVISGNSPPTQTHTDRFCRCVTVFIALISHSEVKVTVVTGHLRGVAAFFNGVFNQIGRSDDIFMVIDVNVADGKHIGNQHNLVIGNALGNVVVAFDDV